MNQPANTPDTPWPVGKVNDQVKGWIERLGYLWVEGQLTQINFKPTWKLSYLTLRDVQQEKSVQLTCPSSMLQSLSAPLKDGDRVIVHGKPAFYAGRGSFSLWTTEIRHVGIGDLLARIEKLRQQLSAEGLFDPARKRPLPYLPHKIGLITGRGSAAERDVMAVAHDRWPAVQFRVLNTAVQGANTVPEVIDALQQLDADPEVDVIIIARGGGSVEDLLPFSEEALQRAVAAAGTPVISAIGHEPDNPVLDNVADVRAATPTDAEIADLLAAFRAAGAPVVLVHVGFTPDMMPSRTVDQPRLPAAEKTRIARRMSELIGLPAEQIEKANLRIDNYPFMLSLLASKGLRTGQLDGRATRAIAASDASPSAAPVGLGTV